MKRRIISRTLIAGILIAAFSCKPITKLTDTITNPSAREIYERDGIDKQFLPQWRADHRRALSQGVSVSLPYGEKGIYDPSKSVARSYTLNVEAGEMLTASVETDSINQKIFLEVFQVDSDRISLKAAADKNALSLEYPVLQSGTYRIVVQPEKAANTKFFLAINKKPSYHFPVAGKGNESVGSFWADVRDGGKRKHEGIDIFAKRGTPVVAVADGTIGYTGERGIGGKQVWLRTGLFGNSIYYAHLDRIAASDGQSVKTGDTLGFVGNTGNAKTTVPHLHFGIYTRGGAIDPLPFVYKTSVVRPASYPNNFKKSAIITARQLNLRAGPSTKYASLKTILPKEKLTLLGQHKDWLLVQTLAGETGFISKKYVKTA